MRLLTAVLLTSLIAPGLAHAQAGRFLMAVGDVVISRGGQQVQASTGTAVQPGDTIRLGVNSNAQVRMTDESIVSLRQNTIFRIDEYVYDGAINGREKTVFSLLKGGFRTITGAIGRLHTREKYQVRTATSTIGIRGTHYVVVHCDNDCGEPQKISVAGVDLAQAGLGTGPGGPNGTFGGVSDGRIDVSNNGANSTTREFGANEFFRVANANSAPEGLIAPPGFLYDRLSGQTRRAGNAGNETPPAGGADNDSRSSDVPPPPAPVTVVVAQEPLAPPAAQKPEIGVLGAWAGADGISSNGGAYVTKSMVTMDASGRITGFNIPQGMQGPGEGTSEGPVSGSATVIPQTGSAGLTNGVNAHWARWGTGSITEDIGTTTFPGGAHVMVGNLTPAEVIASKTGTMTMTSVGAFGTTPTSTNGGTFSGGSFPVLNVDFTNRQAAFSSTSLSFSNGDSWSLGATPAAPISIIPGQGAGFRAQGSASCSGTFCGTISGTVQYTGIFYGPVGDHAGVAISGRAGPTGTTGFNAVRVYCPGC